MQKIENKVQSILSKANPSKDSKNNSQNSSSNMSSIPKTCKAWVAENKGQPFVEKEVPVESPKQGQILCKVLACGVCHSDLFTRVGAMGPMGLIPGHEIIAEVVAVGPDEKKWKVGDRVGGAWHGGHDGLCKSCNRGLFQMCDNAVINGVTINGGYTEYCILRTEAAVSVPKNLDPAEAAPFLCAGVTVFNSMRKMNVGPGETVAIQGLGGLGHLAVQYARKMGYKTIALSSSGAKKDFAMQLGAHEYIDGSKEDTAEALQKRGGAALIVVTAPNAKVMSPLITGLGPLGKLLLLAPVGELLIDNYPMLHHGLSVCSWPSGHALDSEEAIDFAQTHDIKCLVEKFPLTKANEAYDHMMEGKARFRAVLVP